MCNQTAANTGFNFSLLPRRAGIVLAVYLPTYISGGCEQPPPERLGLEYGGERYFITHDVPETDGRGKHAHRVCQQFLVCLRGHCSVTVDDASPRRSFSSTVPTRSSHPTDGLGHAIQAFI